MKRPRDAAIMPVRAIIPYPLRVKSLSVNESRKPVSRSTSAPSVGVRTDAPRVSLVLPVFNGERYLATAIDSILAQSFADFELICVDDCSNDATPAILAEYAARDARIRVVRNATNLKLPASLNRGFREARGEWFSWTSDDNILRPNMLERLLHHAREHPGHDVFHADFIEIDEHGAEGKRFIVKQAQQLALGNCVGACFLYRRTVDAALGGYDETLFGVEDYDFWLRAARQFSFFQIHEDLYQYRKHPDSLTSARARSIQLLAGQLMQREISLLPRSAWRAKCYINLACRNIYRIRLDLLMHALRDDPVVFAQGLPGILRWLGYSVKTRLFGA